MVDKRRIDELLVRLGLAGDLKEARALVMAGHIVVNDQRIDKPGQLIAVGAEIRNRRLPYVSRGGLKLLGALESFHATAAISGASVIDLGASTGGFTDCCLQLGARSVLCVDIGSQQLHWNLRQNPRVLVRENCDLRNLTAEDFIGVDIVVGDISFEPMANLLPLIQEKLPNKQVDLFLLIKPQFELPVHLIPKGGVVSDAELHDQALNQVKAAAMQCGLSWIGSTPSPLKGRSGNQEFFVRLESNK